MGQAVFAQGSGIGISPVSFELTGNPGDVIENQIKVFNPTDNTVGVKIMVEDIAPSGETGGVMVEAAETETYSLAAWVKCDPESFNLEAKQENIIICKITVPNNAEPGGHYGSILAGATTATGVGGTTGVVVGQRAGALVLLTVPGLTKEWLGVKDFQAPGYSEFGPITFTIRFENQGTVHLKPDAVLTITNFMGKKVAEMGVPPKNVLPSAVRKLEVCWDKKWLFGGRYTATLVGIYGKGNTPFAPVKITFWAFPWKILLGTLGLIILLILSRRRWIAALRILIKGEKQ